MEPSDIQPLAIGLLKLFGLPWRERILLDQRIEPHGVKVRQIVAQLSHGGFALINLRSGTQTAGGECLNQPF